MIPPTSIDGTDITGATIDGTDVTEITVDGQTVFTAGPTLPSSAIHRYDPSQLSLSNNATVSTRTDSIGNDDLTGSGTFKTNELNGEPLIEYDGSTDVHSGTLSGTISQPYTIIGAFKNPNYNKTLMEFWANDKNTQLRHDGPDEFTLVAGNPNFSVGSNQLSPVIMAGVYDSTGIVRENGVELGRSSLGSQDLSAEEFNLADIDNVRKYDGLMGEVIIYDDNLVSTGEIAQEENRLASKYGISI